ncbi:MAG TPA: dihydrofolate reductase [Clostridiaceae bacterium]|nr:dihydrofolate reductase [Clostridiaceae bacterium]
MISLIMAMDKNNLIGNKDGLPWRLPADLAYFKKITMGHTVIMGRKTYESISRPLPGRRNVVLTRDKRFTAEGCIICNTLDEALKFGQNEEAFVIGGAEIYSQFLPYARKLYITRIDETFEGDTYFDGIDFSKWRLVSKQEGIRDEKNPYVYYFLVYERDIKEMESE